MVLARDVIDGSSGVLLEKHTELTNENFNMVILSSNSYVFVLENSIFPDRPNFLEMKSSKDSHNILPGDVPVTERKEFVKFEASYDEKPELLSNEFKRISETGVVDEDRLFAMTEEIMGHLNAKNNVFVYLNHLKSVDEPTFSHSVNVSLLANLFSIWINADEEEARNITIAAMLHDIGKASISLEVLNKKGSLSEAEFAEIKTHTVLGYRALEKSKLPKSVKLAALEHHEKIDGSGYPLGITGDKIDKFAKIIAICDIYDAMTSNRIYRSRVCPFDVIKSFERGSYGTLDTEWLLVFLENVAYTYLNSRVRLTNGDVGHVAFINKKDLSNPIIKTMDGRIYDLSDKSNAAIRIVSLV